ncbi:MAG TPA: hypothetical protein VMV69_18105 [Pirellulales bacterium]|nr:hypothetical protein [Pirellulales bacterium]
MSSAWLRTPRLNEPNDFHEHEARAQRYDDRRALIERFGEFSPPRPTVKQACQGCGGTGAAGQFPCAACRGKVWQVGNPPHDEETPC